MSATEQAAFHLTSHARDRARLDGLDEHAILAALERPYRVIPSRHRKGTDQYLIDVDGIHSRAIVSRRDRAVLTVMRHNREEISRAIRQICWAPRWHGRKRQRY